MRAAASHAIKAGFDNPCFLPNVTTKDGKWILAPLLQHVYDHSHKWTPPKYPARQAITLAVLLHLCSSVPTTAGAKLSISTTIRDAAILATFTSSRISKDAQSQVKRACFALEPSPIYRSPS